MGLHVRTSKIARTLAVWKKGQASFRNHRHKWGQPNRTVLSDLRLKDESSADAALRSEGTFPGCTSKLGSPNMRRTVAIWSGLCLPGVRDFESPMSQSKPNTFVVVGFPSPSPMPSGQASGLEIDDLVTYLLTQR